MLDYLHSRLDARDLSGEEALALLSAVHEDLSKSETSDRQLYQNYSKFMESLQTTMPDIHEYVVSAWQGQHDAQTTSASRPEADAAWDDSEGDEDQRPQPTTTGSVDQIRTQVAGDETAEANEDSEVGEGEAEEGEEE